LIAWRISHGGLSGLVQLIRILFLQKQLPQSKCFLIDSRDLRARARVAEMFYLDFARIRA
jgi:hypothetical protein